VCPGKPAVRPLSLVHQTRPRWTICGPLVERGMECLQTPKRNKGGPSSWAGALSLGEETPKEGDRIGRTF
jgi:hypothetical protein